MEGMDRWRCGRGHGLRKGVCAGGRAGGHAGGCKGVCGGSNGAARREGVDGSGAGAGLNAARLLTGVERARRAQAFGRVRAGCGSE